MKAVGVCHKRLKASFQSHGCAAKCATYRGCDSHCDKAKDPEACREKCRNDVSPGFQKCQSACVPDSGEPDAKCMIDCYVNEPCSVTLCELGVH
jgi:hypothetical protein